MAAMVRAVQRISKVSPAFAGSTKWAMLGSDSPVTKGSSLSSLAPSGRVSASDAAGMAGLGIWMALPAGERITGR